MLDQRISAKRRTALAARLSVESARLFEFWRTRGPDREHGGFHGALDRRGEPASPSDKGLIQQARHLWTFSMWYEKKSRTPEVKTLADELHRFLVTHFLDEKSREFQFQVSRAGALVDPKKVLYAEGFVIYGLAQYGRVFGVERALSLSLDCFHSLDARAHDDEFGGYDQTDDPAWLTPGAQKEMNTHLHLLEGFTCLFEATGDATVKARANELLDLAADRMLAPEGYLRLEFLRDWSPFGPAQVSYGHDLEASWLMLECAAALGRAGEAKLVRAADTMARNSAEWGFDSEQGGYFEFGPPAAPADHLEKVWWAQAEALPGLFRLYQRTGDPRHFERMERTFDWIERAQRDAEHGEWFWGILPDGSVGPRGDYKGELWKTTYHSLRALVFTEEWLLSGEK